MAPRAVCSTCGSSGRDTKSSSAPCPWLTDRHTPYLPPLLMDGPGRVRDAMLCAGCCLQWRSSPCSHASLARRLKAKPGSPAETFCRAGGIIQMNLQHVRKEKNLLTPLQHQPSGASHQPPAKWQGYTSTKRSQGTGAKLMDSRALAPPFPIFKEQSREWMRTEEKLVGKHYSEAIYYGVIY